MAGRKAKKPDGRSDRMKMVHALREHMQIIITNVEVLRLTYTSEADKSMLADLDNAARQAVHLFDELEL